MGVKKFPIGFDLIPSILGSYFDDTLLLAGDKQNEMYLIFYLGSILCNQVQGGSKVFSKSFLNSGNLSGGKTDLLYFEGSLVKQYNYLNSYITTNP